MGKNPAIIRRIRTFCYSWSVCRDAELQEEVEEASKEEKPKEEEQEEKVEEASGEEKPKKEEQEEPKLRLRKKKRKTHRDFRKELLQNKERRKNKPAPAPKKREGFNPYSKLNPLFWHSYVG